MNVRHARVDDTPSVLRLAEQLRDDEDEHLPALTVEWVERYLAGGDDEALVAERDGIVVGLLTYRTHDDLFHGAPTTLIEELVVDSGSRGKGVGTALLEEVLRLARQEGCVGLAVNTEFDNEGAQKLYKRVGLTRESLMLGMHFVEPDSGEEA